MNRYTQTSGEARRAARVGAIVGLAVALGANAWFIGSAVQVLRQRTDDAARRMFRVSLAYLFSLFAAMLVELLLRA